MNSTNKQTDPANLLADLIRCPSVTPVEGGALTCLEEWLSQLGAKVDRIVFSDAGTPDVENLYASVGTGQPHLMFAGHTDVVPPGDETKWQFPPYSATVSDGFMYGRGAVDMKGGIACFVAALARVMEQNGPVNGKVSFLITGDEEGPSINGTDKLLKWAAERGERWDGAIVGEPTNPDVVGDMIKIGRRGSLSGRLEVTGVQGHVAYPHLAANPVPVMTHLLTALNTKVLDQGTDRFQVSNLEVTAIQTSSQAGNVIPGAIYADFNVRFNDNWTVDTLGTELERILTDAFAGVDNTDRLDFSVKWKPGAGEAFVTPDNFLTRTLRTAISAQTGQSAELSTSGGTSDARFIKNYCPVVEFGLVGQTMHKVDECVALDDLETLTNIYTSILFEMFYRPQDAS